MRQVKHNATFTLLQETGPTTIRLEITEIHKLWSTKRYWQNPQGIFLGAVYP
jgi:hypothetical protein